MKILFTLFFAFQALFNLLAQGADFAPLGAKWYYTEETYAPPKIFPHIVEVLSKELYQGKLCSKLIGTGPGSLPDPCFVYTQNDTVYFYSLLSNRFEMLYDFSAGVGDSWVIGGLLGDPGPFGSDTIVVDSMSQISINGMSLKVWHISNTIMFDWGDRIIERIGNDGLFGPQYGLYDIMIWGLRCFEDQNVVYHFVPYPCDTIIITTGVTGLDLPEKVQVFPNPVRDKVNIILEGEMSDCSFQVYDLTGKLVKRVPLPVASTEISLEDLPPAIYCWELASKGKRVKMGKLVKLVK